MFKVRWWLLSTCPPCIVVNWYIITELWSVEQIGAVPSRLRITTKFNKV